MKPLATTSGFLPVLLLLAACAAPPSAAPRPAPLTTLAPDDLLGEVLARLAAGDRALPQDDERGVLEPAGDVLALLVAFGPATGQDPRESPRWSEVQAAAQAALARVDDPVAVLGDTTKAFVLNDLNLATLRAGHPLRVATDPELSAWRGLLLDLAGREDEARGWFAGLLASGRGAERESQPARLWRAWRAWRDGDPRAAARAQSEAVRGTLAAAEHSTGVLELLVADLGLLLESAGQQEASDDVLRTLLVRTIIRDHKSVEAPTHARPSWGTRLAESALQLRGVALDPPSTQLVALAVPDVALLALQRGDAGAELRWVAVSGRLGGTTEAWQTWLADEAPRGALQLKAEVTLAKARLGDVVETLQLLEAFAGSVRPYVDDVVENLGRYRANDTDNVAGLDAFLRARLGGGPEPAPRFAVHPAEFVAQWSGWDSSAAGK